MGGPHLLIGARRKALSEPFASRILIIFAAREDLRRHMRLPGAFLRLVENANFSLAVAQSVPIQPARLFQ
jgi:hypothetical protein